MPEILRAYELTERYFTSVIPSYLYVPLNWSDIYLKSQISSLFKKDFGLSAYNVILKPYISKSDGLKILQKYAQWKYFVDTFFIRRKTSDNVETGSDNSDILTLISSGYIFIDQDGNLHLDNTKL